MIAKEIRCQERETVTSLNPQLSLHAHRSPITFRNCIEINIQFQISNPSLEWSNFSSWDQLTASLIVAVLQKYTSTLWFSYGLGRLQKQFCVLLWASRTRSAEHRNADDVDFHLLLRTSMENEPRPHPLGLDLEIPWYRHPPLTKFR